MNLLHLFSPQKWASKCLKPTRQRKVDPRHRFFRPRLEVLEDRTLLTAYMVTLATDNNSGGNGQQDPNPKNLDSGDLRWCLNQADAVKGNSITFANQVNGKTIDLLAVLPDITQSMTIIPAADVSVTVERSNTAATKFRIFKIDAGMTVAFGKFTIQNGNVSGNDGGGIYNNGILTLNGTTIQNNLTDNSGGGIANFGNLTLNGASIVSNQATSGFGAGGGIYNVGVMSTAKGAPLLSLTGNQAAYGAAIYNDNNASATLYKLKIANSIARISGGGIYNDGTGNLTIGDATFNNNQAISGSGGGIFNKGIVTIIQNTFTNNSAGLQGGAIKNVGNATGRDNTVNGNKVTGVPGTLAADETGGGISNDPGATFSLVNSIVAGNTAPTNPDVDGNFTDDGHNFIGDGTGSDFINGVNGDQVGDSVNPLDPMLGPLQENGGNIDTELPLAGSPVIDAGDNSYAATTDERGYVRIINNTVDIGAMEANSYPYLTATISGSVSGTNSGSNLSCNFSGNLSDSSDNVIGGIVFHAFSFGSISGIDAGEVNLDDGTNYNVVNGTFVFSINGSSISGSFSSDLSNGSAICGSFSGSFSGTIDGSGNISGSFSGTLEMGGDTGGGSSASRPQFTPAGTGLYSNGGAVTLSSSALSNNASFGPSETRGDSSAGTDLVRMAQLLSALDSHPAGSESMPLIPASIQGAKTSPPAQLLGSTMAGWAGTGQGQWMQSLLNGAKSEAESLDTVFTNLTDNPLTPAFDLGRLTTL
jgi:hypothetical protein